MRRLRECLIIMFVTVVVVVSTTHQNVVFAAVSKIYWAGVDKIQRANPDGSNIETLITGLITPTAIALERVMHFRCPMIHWENGTQSIPQRCNG